MRELWQRLLRLREVEYFDWDLVTRRCTHQYLYGPRSPVRAS